MNVHPAFKHAFARLLLLAMLPATVAGFGSVTASASKPAASSSCLSGAVKHVIYLQFDNTHYNRDRPNVASDLEQMPHLLNFLKSNGTLFINAHTILISHTAGGILSSLTGLYPDRQGQTVSNSYDYYPPSKLPQFTSSFKYWTDPVSALDPLKNMITDGQKNTPAPWVPYTRAGCDFGGVGTANIELESNSASPTGDIANVFGTSSTQLAEAAAHPGLAQTDFVGIAIHCAQAASSKCAANPTARPDALPDEPGGYLGYQALFGARYVDPAITSPPNPCVNDTAGQPITDPDHNCGFPGFDGMLAKNTLGYVEQMQSSGVPVTYGYISDAHDIHVPNPATDSYQSHANGPGEADFKAQLKAYDDAFVAFFQHLAASGIDKSNTMFVVTVDEGDHFAGGIGTPQPNGSLAYAHTSCSNLSACPSDQIGEVNANIKTLLPAAEPGFDIHFDDAPTFYVNGQPTRTDPTVRKLERDTGNLTAQDPYVNNGQVVPLTVALADTVGEQALHMVNTDPSRTPTFTMFANPDFFFQTFPTSCGGNPCVNPTFAWNHGDIQPEIGNTWVGFVGPGVTPGGIDATTWTDHTNLRPTILALAGLKDDYLQDGRVLIETIRTDALPQSLIAHRETLLRLGAVYEQVNASFGQFNQDVLAASTRALKSGTATDDSSYTSIENAIISLSSQRDTLAGEIRTALNAAAFDNQPVNEQQAKGWIDQGQSLIDQAAALAAG